MVHKALINVKEEYFTLLCNKKLFILSNYSLDGEIHNKGKQPLGDNEYQR